MRTDKHKTKQLWCYEFMYKRKRYGRRYDYPTPEAARNAGAKHRLRLVEQAAGGLVELEPPPFTLRDLREMAEKKAFDRKARNYLRIYIAALGDENIPLAMLTEMDWEPFIERLGSSKPQSLNRCFTWVRGIFKAALGWFPDLKAFGWRPPHVEYRKTLDVGRKRPFEKIEMARLFAAMIARRRPGEQRATVERRHEFYDFWRLMLLTGCRPGELCRMKPHEIDWDERTVIVVTYKGGKPKRRIVALSETAIRILEKYRRRAKFFTFRKNQIERYTKRIADIAGVPYGQNVERGIVFYDLRHVASSKIQARGSNIPFIAVSGLLGHLKDSETMTYSHAEMEDLFAAVEKLERYVLEIEALSHTLNSETISNGKSSVKSPLKESKTDHMGHSI